MAGTEESLDMLGQRAELVQEPESGNEDEKKPSEKFALGSDEVNANVSQRQRNLTKLYNDIMKENDPKGHVTQFDKVFLQSFKKGTSNATFYSYKEGRPLVLPPVKGFFAASIETHSPNISMWVSNEDEVAALRRKSKAGRLVDPSVEPEGSNKEKREYRQIINDAKARATKVKACIGFKGLRQHKQVPIENWKEFARSHKNLAAHFSGEMKNEVKRILASKYGYAIYYETAFNLEEVAQDKLFLGCPEWATDFGATFKEEQICVIIDGSKQLGRRIRFVGEMMDDEKAFGARFIQMWMENSNARGLALQPNRIRTEPKSEHIKNETYKYNPQLPNYNWDETCVKLGVSIMQIRKVLGDRKTQFENEIHHITLFNVPGTHDGHLMGFIDWPLDDAVLLTPGTQLRLTFVEDEKDGKVEDVTDDDSEDGTEDKAEDDSEKQIEDEDKKSDNPEKESGKGTSESDSGTKEQGHTEKNQPAPASASQPQNTTGLLPAHEEFEADFPYDAGILRTPADELLCGLHALIRSIERQHPEDTTPTLKDLQEIVAGPFYQGLMVPGMENVNFFNTDQLKFILEIWYNQQENPHRAQLCILRVTDDSAPEPTKLHTPHPNARRTWIHHEGMHWQGLRPLTKEEGEIEKEAPNEDADIEFLAQKLGEKGNYWKVRVLPPVPNGPENQIPVIVTIPWDKEKQQFVSKTLKIVETAQAAEYEFRAILKDVPTHKVKLKVIDSIRQSKCNIEALEMLNYAPKDKPFTRHNLASRHLLTCNNLHKLDKRDMFQRIREAFPNPEDLMKLNPEQRAGILAMAEAPGGFGIVWGVPGSGKTYLACEALKPFLMSEKIHPILMTSGSNEAADNMIRGAVKVYEGLVKAGKAKPGLKLLRLYSTAADKAIRARHLKAQLEKDPNSRPDVDEVDMDELSNMQAVIRHMFNGTRMHKYEGVHDPRVKDIEYSLGQALLTETGLVYDPIYTPENADSEYEAFRKQFKKYHGTKEMSSKQRKEYAVKENEVLIKILSEAAVIVCTMYVAGSQHVAQAISDNLVGIVVDEAFHELTEDFLPLFAIRANPDFVLFLGDPDHTAPPKLHSKAALPFAEEYYLPLASRLIKLGFPVIKLRNQSRMVPRISSLASKLTYGGDLGNVLNRCGMKVRENSRAFCKFVAGNWQDSKSVPVVFLDTTGKLSDTDKHGTSKLCWYQAIITVNLVPKLLRLGKDVTIGLIASHAPQRNLLLSALAAMQLDPLMKDAGLDRVHIGTIDSLIGKEFTYSVLNLLVDDAAGLLEDLRRINMGITRARDGLIVLLSGRAVSKLDIRTGRHLKDLVKLLTEYRVEQRCGKTFPNCRWITPDVSQVRPWTASDAIVEPNAPQGNNDGDGTGDWAGNDGNAGATADGAWNPDFDNKVW